MPYCIKIRVSALFWLPRLTIINGRQSHFILYPISIIYNLNILNFESALRFFQYKM